VGSSQADKAANHQRIVKAAAARIRERGVDGVSVVELMKQAGLTHGGFYRHFASRDELVTEAVALALEDGSKVAESAAQTGGEQALLAIINGYLSEVHRDHPESGCAVAALPTEIQRAPDQARAAYTSQVHRYLDLLGQLTPDADPDEAYLILSAIVGGVLLARAVDEPALSRELLERSARALRGRR
jgi:TetR/AcrR family transcriptional repressor of nem operon